MNDEFVHWREIAMFRDLSEADLQTVQAACGLHNVPAGQNLITEGEEGDEMYILIRGRVRISKSMLLGNIAVPLVTTGDSRKVLATLDASAYPLFGEIALLDRDTRSATVAVVEDAAFLVLERSRFFELIRVNPSLGVSLLLAIGGRLAATVRRNNQELVKLTTALALALDRAAK